MYFSGENLTAVPGQVVHPECRKNCCHPNIQSQVYEKDIEHSISNPRTQNFGGGGRGGLTSNLNVYCVIKMQNPN